MSLKLKVAFSLPTSLGGHKSIESYLHSKYDAAYRLFRMISEAMSFHFEVVTFNTTNKLLPSGSWEGVIGMVSRSEADIAPDTLLVAEQRKEVVHFSYPFRLYSSTFIIEKPEYSPQIFGLSKGFSLSIWLTLGLFIVGMAVITYILMRRKYSLHEVVLHVLAVCLQQSMMIKPRKAHQTLLIYSWLIGTMFLGFCYSSVLLSFLTFPSAVKIRDMEDLAHAVENDGYECMFESYISVGPALMVRSELKSLVTLGKHMDASPEAFAQFEDFFHMRRRKLAFFNTREAIPSLPENYFVSEDSILESMGAMIVRKDFCCKEKLDETVHRIMAAGLYVKVKGDSTFLSGLKFEYTDVKTHSERKLTLKDFLLAFSILLFGYFLSFVVFIFEMVVSPKTNQNETRPKTKRRMECTV